MKKENKNAEYVLLYYNNTRKWTSAKEKRKENRE